MITSSLFFVVAVLSLWSDLSFGQDPGIYLILPAILYDQAPATMNHSRYPENYWIYGTWVNNPKLGSCGTANGGWGFSPSDFELPLFQYGNPRIANAPGGKLTNGEPGLVGDCCNASTSWTNCGRLGSDRTPIYRYKGASPYNTIQGPDTFYDWFHQTPRTWKKDINLTLSLLQGRTYGYTNTHFFPLDNAGWNDSNLGEEGPGIYHNYAYTMQIHASFRYTGGEVFSFRGDDDVWVYLDNRLMIDMGGIHTEQTATIKLDDIPGLQIGGLYTLDFFYAERHTTLSKFQLTTSIGIICTYYDWCGNCEGDGQVCCTAEQKAHCTQDNKCYSGTCAILVPPTVSCQYTVKNCDDNDVCTIDTCVNATGCHYDPKSCDDGKICTDDKCDPVTGCSHTPIQCPGDKCNRPSCDPIGGCKKTLVPCDDGDECTLDDCDPNSGCTHTLKDCNDHDKCTNDTCNPKIGCQNLPITCSDQSLCTDDKCSSTLGCQFIRKLCKDNDTCTVDGCDDKVGCTNIPITSCNPITGPCSPDSCVTYDTCVPRQCDENGDCVGVPVPCTDNNLCTIDSCSNSTNPAKCEFKAVNCSQADPCNPQTCDGETGKCVAVPVNCDDGNYCTTDTCVISGGIANCTHRQISCDGFDTGEQCTTPTCNSSVGCVPGAWKCNDHNPCTTDKCVGPMNCSNIIGKVCDDSDPCTDDTCDSTSDTIATCSHMNTTCVPPSICQVVAGCDSNGNGCVFVDKPCPPSDDYCKEMVCDAKVGCVSVPRVCVVPDGDCYIGACDSVAKACSTQKRADFATLTSEKGGGVTCFALYEKTATAAIITGGIIAAIVVAAVVFAVLAALGARQAYIYLAVRQGNMAPASNNPLYTASAGSGTNPLHVGH